MKIQREIAFGAEEWIDEETCQIIIYNKLKELLGFLIDAMVADIETYNIIHNDEIKLFSIDISYQQEKWDYKLIARVKTDNECDNPECGCAK